MCERENEREREGVYERETERGSVCIGSECDCSHRRPLEISVCVEQRETQYVCWCVRER